jgi:hypothetical protein
MPTGVTCVTDYRTEYPTRGDLAREQLRQRGIPYFGDVQQEVHQQLSTLSPAARKAFALACAERALHAYSQTFAPQQHHSLQHWRSLLSLMWSDLIHKQRRTRPQVRKALDDSDLDADDDMLDDRQEMIEDIMAVCVSAAECYFSGGIQLAYDASSAAIDVAFRIADMDLQLDPNDFIWDPHANLIPLAREAMHEAVQMELQTQLRHITLVEQHEITPQLIDQLRYAPLS